MLVFLAVLAVASAASFHDGSRVQILPATIQSGPQAPVSLIQLLRNPAQTILSPRDTQVQIIGQSRYQFEPDNRQYSLVSVEPQTQYSIQPQDQQQLTIVQVQPQAEQLVIERATQPIEVEKQIILQPVNGQQKQIVTILEPNQQRQIQNLHISSEAQPISLQYANIAQPVHQSSVSVHSRPSIRLEQQRPQQGKAQQYSYFVRGSDLENQQVVSQVAQPQVTVIKQHLQPPQYSSVSVLEPRISSVVVQEAPQSYAQQLVYAQQQQQQPQQQQQQQQEQQQQRQQQQIGVVGYANLNSNHRIFAQSVQDDSK